MFNAHLEHRITRLENQMFQLLLQLSNNEKDRTIREQADEIKKLKNILNKEQSLTESFRAVGNAMMETPD